MVAERKKKYKSGEGAQYWSRGTALRKLQLSLKDFRRLCILKGIYPREPRNRKRAQQGATGIKTLYHKKDIQFLMHEPIIWKLRDLKAHGKRIGRAKGLHEFGLARRLINTPPNLQLDHIVKERYPTFIDALRDLDDCLTLCFLFSTFPSLRHVPRDQSSLCRRLTMEFLHAVIASKSLRKVFISIKGYYFQAEIQGVLITWIMPHHFSFEPQSKEEVDFKIMATFVQFYIILLGFVNFKLYHTFNLFYPPKFGVKVDGDSSSMVDEGVYVSERVAALNMPIVSTSTEPCTEEEVQIDTFNLGDDPDQDEKVRIEAEKIWKLKTLFKGLKVFLGREVPREPLTFTLRCFGGEVSWDKTHFLGATFQEDDETITHQIVDRPKLKKQFISRYYVQPQWVFDSVNARELLPVEKYLIGCTLPPHLSPFVDDTRTQYYIPPEASPLTEQEDGEVENNQTDANEDAEETSEEIVDNVEDEEEEDASDSVEDRESDLERKELKKKMSVSPGKILKEDPLEKRKEEKQEFKLRERMIEKKHRALYKSMVKGRAERMRDVRALRRKRALLDAKQKASATTK